jgi:purine-cytosine permease-like protein
MNWSDIGSMVGRAAPVVGTLLGGPAGAAVGALVASALNVPNDPESVNAVLAGNPDALAKIQELQINAKVQLQQLAVTAENNRLQAEGAQFAAEAADRDSARKLAAQQPNDLIRPAVTIILLLGALSILVCIFTGIGLEALQNPVAASTISLLIGLWFSELKQTLGFYFGVTKESQKQNAIVTQFAVEPGTVTKPDK